jgi:hypothetical protein
MLLVLRYNVVLSIEKRREAQIFLELLAQSLFVPIHSRVEDVISKAIV